MSEQIIFKNQTFGGFNKEDVLKYIDELNVTHTEELKNAEEAASQLSTDLNSERARREESEKSFAELMSAYEELRQHYMMLKEQNEKLESENAALSARADEAEKELGIQKELNGQLSEKIAAGQRKEEEQVAEQQRLVAAAGEVGDSAHRILNVAKNNAQTLVADARLSAENLNGEIDHFCDEVEKTKSFMEDSLTVLLQRLEYIEKTAAASKIVGVTQTDRLGAIQESYEKYVCDADTKVEDLKNHFFR